MEGGPFYVIGLFLAVPVVAFLDWFKWIKRQPTGGPQELAKACHGAGLVALLAVWFCGSGEFDDFTYGLVTQQSLLCWLPIIVAAWGLGWLLLNARYAAQAIGRPQRATMTVRALIKIAIGGVLWLGAGPGNLLVQLPAAWCLATGGTKLLLMIWGGAREKAYPMVEQDIAAKEFDWDQ